MKSRDVVISLTVVFNLAVAQPLLDLVGRHAPFLVAHDASRPQIWALAFLLSVGIPVALGLITLAIARLNRGLGTGLHVGLLGLLTTALILRVLEELPAIGQWNGWLLVVVAVLAASGVTYLFHARDSFRSLLRFGAPLPLIVIGLFAFASPVERLLWPASVDASENASGAHDVPVVMIIFDELPLASMMTVDREIDDALFPNFARLARDSTWFRNATTVHDMTAKVVPAILDGNYPRDADLPVYSDHPVNVFTLLGPTHRVEAIEPVTALCPPRYCGSQAAELGALASDLWVLANHLVLPDDLTGWLPELGDTWAGFAEQQTTHRGDPRELVEQFDKAAHARNFVDQIGERPLNSFHFLHLTLPHVPWEYLPSGQRYFQEDIPGKVSKRWARDPWLVAQGYQRHMLQAQFTDRILGDVLDKLEDAGIYDETLVVVLADHGKTIAPGRRPRDGAPDSVGSVASVPLFVKRPFERGGRVVDVPVETIDVVPTLVDVLNLDTDARFDGTSLFGELDPDRIRGMPIEGFQIDPSGAQVMRYVRARYEIFGDAVRDPYALAPPGLSSLIGRRVDSLVVASNSSFTASLADAAEYERVDPDGPLCPCMVDARLTPTPPPGTPIAVAVNGLVVSVTKTPVADDPEVNKRRFYAMVPPDSFTSGHNGVTFFLVEPGPMLHPIARS